MLRVGCCGFPTAREAYYARFPVVEVQRTFYQPPRLATCERWRAEAPEGFEFALKAWQLITHPSTSPTYRRLREKIGPAKRYGFFRPTDEVFAAWDRTADLATALEARLVVFQCPASLTPTAEHFDNMRAFFHRARRDSLVFLWEPRGEWEDHDIARLCRGLDLVHCVDPFKRQPVTGGLAYFRLHGIRGYRSQYSDDDLSRLVEWCAGYENAYCLFNNMSMLEDATRLVERAAVRPGSG